MTKEKFEDMAQNICEHEYGEESDDEKKMIKILKRMMKRHIMLIKILNIMMIMLFTLLL